MNDTTFVTIFQCFENRANKEGDLYFVKISRIGKHLRYGLVDIRPIDSVGDKVVVSLIF